MGVQELKKKEIGPKKREKARWALRVNLTGLVQVNQTGSVLIILGDGFFSFFQPLSLSSLFLEREALPSLQNSLRSPPSSPATLSFPARWPASYRDGATASELKKLLFYFIFQKDSSLPSLFLELSVLVKLLLPSL